MIRCRPRYVDVDVRAVLARDTVEAGEGYRRAVVRICVSARERVRGRNHWHRDVTLGSGTPVSKLQEALRDLEGDTGLNFEAFEVVDVARQFFALAQDAGFKIKGFPVPPAPDDAQKPMPSSGEPAPI